MSATDVTTRGSLKRKLEGAEADLPSSKRQKLNDDQRDNHNKVSNASLKIIIDGHTLNILPDNHVTALHDTLLTLRTKSKEQNTQHAEDVLTDTLITQLSQFAPISLDHLTHFDAMNDANISDIGDQLISVISDYIRSHSLQSPFQIHQSDTINTLNGTNGDPKSEETVQSTNNPSSESTESEQPLLPKPQIRIKKKKRFLDSESEDDDDNDMDTTASSKPKFVYGEKIETIGHTIPDVMDEHEEEPSDEDQDNDLDGFVVSDEDIEDEDEDDLVFHRRVLRRHTHVDEADQDDEEDLFDDEEDSEHAVETLETHEDSDDSVVIMGRDTNRRRSLRNPTPSIEEDDEDRLQRTDTTDSLRPQLLRFYSDEVMHGDIEAEENDAEAMEDDIEDMDGDELSDGESLNSIDDEIEREMFGIDDVRFADLSFENAVKRGSLVDMIKIFENGMDIQNCASFWLDYGDFMKIFRDKCTKAMRLISALFPLGFGDETPCGKVSEFKLVEKRADDDVGIDEHSHPIEFELLRYVQNEEYYTKIPGLLLHGVSPHAVPKFFGWMDGFRTAIICKWFEAITYQNIELIQSYHEAFGIPIDLNIPRKLIKHVLSTDFEHLQGATGLVIASLVGALEIVTYCVDHGADLEYKTRFGQDTALMFASKRGNLAVVKYLCENGANINAITTQSEAYAETPSPVAFETLIHKQKEVLQYLAYYGADLYLMGPSNSRGEKVNVMRLCLMEEKYALDQIKDGLKQRFDLIKQCLAKQFVDIDITTNIASIICDHFLDPTHEDYLNALKYEYMIDWD